MRLDVLINKQTVCDKEARRSLHRLCYILLGQADQADSGYRGHICLQFQRVTLRALCCWGCMRVCESVFACVCVSVCMCVRACLCVCMCVFVRVCVTPSLLIDYPAKANT